MADFESPKDQTEEHVEEAVPHSDIATTVSDVPPDFGDPSVADFPDVAFGEPVDEDDEVPDPDEPDEDEDEDEDDEPLDVQPLPDEDEESEEPVLPPDEGES